VRELGPEREGVPRVYESMSAALESCLPTKVGVGIAVCPASANTLHIHARSLYLKTPLSSLCVIKLTGCLSKYIPDLTKEVCTRKTIKLLMHKVMYEVRACNKLGKVSLGALGGYLAL
jgi:hypothetical protein